MIRLRTLGTLDLTVADGSELRAVLSQPRRTALLVYLAVATPRGFHRRDHLMTLFWPEYDQDRARSSLNRAIYFLRRELGDGVIISRGAEEIGVSFESLWCDVAAFDDALDRGDATAALEWYRGDLLPGFFAARAEGFERWLDATRSRLRERGADAAWSAAANSECHGELALAAHFARQGVELAPFDEVGVRRLLTLLDRTGDRAGAVRAYQELAERMAKELELDPSPETRALIDEIRSRAMANGSVEDATVRTHGTASIAANGAPPMIRSTGLTRRPRMWAVTTVAVAVAAALTLTLPAIGRARTDPRSVYVAAFVNRTLDGKLDDLGRIAADRIAQSLSATGLVDPLPPGSRNASSARAGSIVSGEFHRDGNRIVFQTWVTDARRNHSGWAIRPASAPVDSVVRAIDDVSRRVSGAVAALRSPSLGSWFPIATSPPTFDAFQEFADAVDLQSRGFDKEAVDHLRRAVDLDPTFTWARMQLALAYINLFEQTTADSIIAELDRDRAQLNPLQRHWLAWMLSFRTEDHLAGYRAIRAAADMAPERFLYNVANLAMWLNRPREAIDVLNELGPNNPHAGGPGAYWGLLTRAYHAVGDGNRELAAARSARRANVEPMLALSFEARALASLGRIDDVRRLLDTALTLPMEQGPTALQLMVGIARNSSPAQLMVSAAQELRAHGHEEAAQEALARALAWYRSHPPYGESAAGRRFEIAKTLYLSRDWAAADTAFRALVAADTGHFIYRGFLGTIAARRHDDAAARQVIAKFDSLRPTLDQPKAEAGYWQSKINAILGDEERALVLMSEVWGLQGNSGIHAEFDYERLWRSTAFRAFVRPKG